MSEWNETDPDYQAELEKARAEVAAENRGRRWGGIIGWLLIVAGAFTALLGAPWVGGFGILIGVLLVLGNRWGSRR